MKKKRRLLQSDTLWGMAALLLVVLQFWWLPGEDGSASDSYSTTVDGKLGLFRTLHTLFPRVERNAVDLVPEGNCTLVIVGPDRYPTDEEQARLYEYVYRGGTLVFAPNVNDPSVTLSSLGVNILPRAAVTPTVAPTPVPASVQPTSTPESDNGDQSSATTDAQKSETKDSTDSPAETPDTENGSPESAGMESSGDSQTAANEDSSSSEGNAGESPEEILDRAQKQSGRPAANSPPDIDDVELQEVSSTGPVAPNSVTLRTNASLREMSYRWNVLLTGSSGDVEAAEWTCGNGKVVACSSSDLFSNRSMLFPPSRRAAVRLIERATKVENVYAMGGTFDSGRIVISEYFNSSDSYQSTGILFSPSMRIGTLQLLLVAVLAVWLAFHRFGPCQDVSTLQRRSLSESAQAVGNLQYRLFDGGSAVGSYLDYLKSLLRRRYGSLVRIEDPASIATRAGMPVEEVSTRISDVRKAVASSALGPVQSASMIRWLAMLQQKLTGSNSGKKDEKN